MKKKWIYVLALAGVLTVTAACGGEKKSEDSTKSTETGTSEFPDSSVTKLGAYKGVEIEAVNTEVTDEEIQTEIEYLLSAYPDTQLLDKTVVEDGDIVNIDFKGMLDGEAFEGGTSGEGGYNLTIGSGSFIPGFEDGLIGREVGTACELPLTFPESYPNNPDLAGQDVVFEVTIHGIVEYVDAEWNDEFVQTHTDYDSVEDYMEGTRASLEADKIENAPSEKEYRVIQAVIADSEFDCAQSDLDSLMEETREQYTSYASYMGADLETFLLYYMGMTEEEFEVQIADLADFQLKSTLVVEAVTEAEGIRLTEDEYIEGLESLAADYQYASGEAFEEQYGRDAIESSLIYDKTISFLVENAVEI